MSSCMPSCMPSCIPLLSLISCSFFILLRKINYWDIPKIRFPAPGRGFSILFNKTKNPLPGAGQWIFRIGLFIFSNLLRKISISLFLWMKFVNVKWLDNKNKFILGFAAVLVEKKIFSSVLIYYLQPGHSFNNHTWTLSDSPKVWSIQHQPCHVLYSLIKHGTGVLENQLIYRHVSGIGRVGFFQSSETSPFIHFKEPLK